jgi:hypothetical protein
VHDKTIKEKKEIKIKEKDTGILIKIMSEPASYVSELAS